MTYVTGGRARQALPSFLHEVVGKRREEFLPREGNEGVFLVYEIATDQRLPFRNLNFKVSSAEVGVHFIQLSGRPVFDRRGRLAGYRGTGADITAAVQAEDQVTAAREQLNVAIETLQDGFVLYDADHKLVHANKTYRTMFPETSHIIRPGVSFKEVFDAHADLYLSNDQENVEQWRAEVLSTEIDTPTVLERETSDGRWILYRNNPVRDGGFVGIRTDITDLKRKEQQLRESEEMLRSVIENAPDMIKVLDGEGRITFQSPSIRQVLGHEVDDVMGRNVFDFVHPDDQRLASVAFSKGRKNGRLSKSVVLRLRSIDENWRYIEFFARKMDQPTGSGDLVINARNVSVQREAQEAMREAKESAELASRAKSEFLATMSHELRTPLNAIIGFSELMASGHAGEVNEKQSEYLRDIRSSGIHLLSVINDILDLSKVEAGRIDLNEERIDIAELAQRSGRLVRGRAEEGELTINYSFEPDIPHLRADKRILKKIMINLLSNAVKFTEPGGTISVGATVRSDGDLDFYVADTGIGIARKDIVKALSTFGQIEGTASRRYEGTGLGLPLVKSFTELHGGEVEIESELGVGTTVHVIMPAARLFPSDVDALHSLLSNVTVLRTGTTDQ